MTIIDNINNSMELVRDTSICQGIGQVNDTYN